MTVRLTVTQDKVNVESDTHVLHQNVYDDSLLIGAMRVSRIEKVEGSDDSQLRADFDRQYKKKTGQDGYTWY